MSELYDLYKKLGNEGFTRAVVQMAPYFGTIDPHFVALKPGYAEVKVEDHEAIHNHLGTVHAIALCNAAELVAGVMTDVSLPEGRRWIPIAMTVRYLAKAQTDLRAVADGAGIDWSRTGELVVPVEIFDANGQKVFTAAITMNVKAH